VGDLRGALPVAAAQRLDPRPLAACRDLRRGEFDVLVGINLLREGLDIPEVSLVGIGSKLDAGLPAGNPTGAEMRKLVPAGYNGGPFGMIAAAQEVAGKGSYTWETISTNQARWHTSRSRMK